MRLINLPEIMTLMMAVSPGRPCLFFGHVIERSRSEQTYML